MYADRAPKTGEPETVRLKPDAVSSAEDARLDDAMRQADDLLLRSLRSDDRRRHRRRIIVFVTIGVLIMISIVGIILISVASNPTAANSSPTRESVAQAKADNLSQAGWELWQQRHLAEAEEKFEQAVKLDPKLVNAWNGLGWSEFNEGKMDAAEKAFEKAIELEPGHAAAENGLGQLYFSRREYDKAEKHFLISVKTPNSSAAWYGLTKLYLLGQHWDKAAEWAQKLVDGGYDDAKPMLDAAKAGKIPASLRQQITPPPMAKASPDGAVFQKGWMQLNKGQTAEAVATFKSILDKNPNDANALNGLGWAYLHSPDKESDAQEAFEKAIKADPDAAGSMNGLAIIFKNHGKTDEAIKLWTDMLKRFPGPNAATYGLASTYLEEKQFDKAVPLYEQLAKAEPNNAEIQQSLEKARAGAAK